MKVGGWLRSKRYDQPKRLIISSSGFVIVTRGKVSHRKEIIRRARGSGKRSRQRLFREVSAVQRFSHHPRELCFLKSRSSHCQKRTPHSAQDGGQTYAKSQSQGPALLCVPLGGSKCVSSNQVQYLARLSESQGAETPRGGRGRLEAPTCAAGRAGPPHRRTRPHTAAARSLPIGETGRAGPARPKTNNLRPESLCGRAAAWPRPGERRGGSRGHLVPPPPGRGRPGRPRPRGAAAGLYWAGPKVEARFCCGRPARTCCPGGRRWQGGCGRGGLEDRVPWALEAKAVLSSRVAGTPSDVSSVPRGRLPETWTSKEGILLDAWTDSRCAGCFLPERNPEVALAPAFIAPKVSKPRSKDSTAPSSPLNSPNTHNPSKKTFQRKRTFLRKSASLRKRQERSLPGDACLLRAGSPPRAPLASYDLAGKGYSAGPGAPAPA